VLRVGLNGLPLEAPHSGTATYTRHVGRLLTQHELDVAPTLYLREAESQAADIPNVRVRYPLDRAGSAVGRRVSKLAWEEVVVPAASAARRDDLLHYPYFAVPVAAAAPVVVTVHDLITLVMPGYHRSRQSAGYSRLMARLARRAQAIITVSEYSRREIVSVLGVPEERVHVTYEAAGTEFSPSGPPGERESLQDRYGLPPRFVLYLGGAERRKNIETVLRAWKAAWMRGRIGEFGLVIVARFPPADSLYPNIPVLARDLDLAGVHFVDSIPEQDKPAFFRAASAFVYPSVYEGFGLPPLEAMATGTPVLAANATSLPEIIGDGGVLVPPYDVSAWAEALEQVLVSGTLRAAMRDRGLRRAVQFSWDRTAEETAGVYRDVLGR
jgi:glycosyltransferase involved in cell wall biosynthesis